MTDTILGELLRQEAALHAFVRRLVASDDVDDVVQSTWLAVVRHPGPTRALLTGIARRLAALVHRRRVRREHRERLAARTEAQPGGDELVLRIEAIQRVAAAVAGLPEPYRRTIVRHYHGGEPVAELAAAEQVDVATVRKRLQRGRDLLRARLAAEFGAGWRSCAAIVALCRSSSPRSVGGLAAGLIAAGLVVASAAYAFRAPVAPVVVRVASAGSSAPVVTPALPVAVAAATPHERVPVRTRALQDPEPAPASWTLRVRVLGLDGMPMRAAIVRHGVVEAWSDGNGACSFELRGALADQPDRITVRPAGGRQAVELPIVHDGVAAHLATVAPRGGEVALQLAFTARHRSIAGRVLAADGEPAAGVTVFLGEAEPLDPGSLPRAPLQPLEDLASDMEGEVVMGEGQCITALHATTAADGTFTLSGLRSRAYVLHAVDWRAATMVASAPTPVGTPDLALRLPAAASRTVRGVVRDPQGRGIGDVEVVALMPLLRIEGVTGHHVVARTRSGPDGAFEFAAPAQASAVAVRSADLLPRTQPLVAGDAPSVLVTDRPHGMTLAAGIAPMAAVACQVLDAQERVLWLHDDRDSRLPPRQAWPLTGTPADRWFTTRDAAIVQFLDAEGRVLGRRPVALVEGTVTPIR